MNDTPVNTGILVPTAQMITDQALGLSSADVSE